MQCYELAFYYLQSSTYRAALHDSVNSHVIYSHTLILRKKPSRTRTTYRYT